MCKTAKTSSLLRSDISRELQLTGSTTDGQKDFTLLWKSCHLRWHSPLYPQTLLRICSGQSWCICRSPPKKRLWWSDWRTCPGPETPRTGTLKVRRVRGAAQQRHHDFTFNAPPAVLFTPPPRPPFWCKSGPNIHSGFIDLCWIGRIQMTPRTLCSCVKPPN